VGRLHDDTDADALAGTHGYTYAVAHANSDHHGDTNGESHSLAHGNSDHHRDTNGESHSHGNTDTFSDADTVRFSDADGYANCDEHTNPHSYRICECDANSHADAGRAQAVRRHRLQRDGELDRFAEVAALRSGSGVLTGGALRGRRHADTGKR
jgi:hypothetical protein